MRRQLKPGPLFPYARIAHEKGPGYEASMKPKSLAGMKCSLVATPYLVGVN